MARHGLQCCFWTCVVHRCSCWSITENDGNSSVLLQQQVTDTWYYIRPQTLMHSTAQMCSDITQYVSYIAFMKQILHNKNTKRAMQTDGMHERIRALAKISQHSTSFKQDNMLQTRTNRWRCVQWECRNVTRTRSITSISDKPFPLRNCVHNTETERSD